MHNSLLIVNNTDRRNGRKSLDIYMLCDRYYLVILRILDIFLLKPMLSILNIYKYWVRSFELSHTMYRTIDL